MKFKDGKTISAYVRSKLHSGYITTCQDLTIQTAVFISIYVLSAINTINTMVLRKKIEYAYKNILNYQTPYEKYNIHVGMSFVYHVEHLYQN